MADRGQCTFLEKAINAVEAGALGLVVINNSSQCLWVGGGGNASDASTRTRLQRVQPLFVAGADNATAAELLESAAVLRARVFVARTLDPAAAILLALALFTLVAAAVWSGKTFEAHLRREQQRRTGTAAALVGSGDEGGSGGGGMGEQINVTLPVVAAFVLFASAMMFVLFFVLNKWIFYIFLAIFAYGSFTATVVCLRAAMGAAAPRTRKCLLTLPRLNIDVAPRDLVACAAAAALLIAWLADRHAAWAWVPQDALGVFFMVMIAQVITLPDGRVATAFLLALFCYDVFMVFITPLFMPRGDSVMVHVARGGSTNEVMPMLLLAPRVLPPVQGQMMLGYGDVVVPGLVITMMRRFDVAAGRSLWHGYFLPLLLAYTVGVVLTDVALELHVFGSQGQPALMYLVPCMLCCTWGLAWWRGDVAALWAGRVDDWKDHASGSDDTDVEQQPPPPQDGAAGRRAGGNGGALPQSTVREVEEAQLLEC